MKKNERIAVFSICGAILAFLALFPGADLAISQTLFTKNLYGRVFEVVGELPFVLLSTTAACLFFRFRSKKNIVLNILLGLLSAFLVVFLAFMGGFMTANYLADNLGSVPGFVAPAITVLLVMLAAWLAGQVPQDKAREAVTYAIIAVVYFILVLIVMNSIKTVWGRMRIREMGGDFSQFTPWYQVCSRGGFDNRYASFPSGHTMNSAAVILLSLLPTFLPKLRGRETLLRSAAYAWIVIVGVSRVVMGAHFASDVTAGAMLSLALFDLVQLAVTRLRGKKARV